MKKIIIACLVLLLLSMTGLAADRYPFSNAIQQHRFYHLIQQFRCLVCQNEDLASSNAALAEDLRQQIYSMLNTGKTDPDIIHYMVNRYGNFVLFKPPLIKSTIFIWCAPFLLLILGFIIFYRVVRGACSASNA